MTAFEQYAKHLFTTAFDSIGASMLGYKLPLEKDNPLFYIEYEVLEDFEYDHIDQDINRGLYKFTKGQIINLHDEPSPIFFLPDRSKLKQLRRYDRSEERYNHALAQQNALFADVESLKGMREFRQYVAQVQPEELDKYKNDPRYVDMLVFVK